MRRTTFRFGTALLAAVGLATCLAGSAFAQPQTSDQAQVATLAAASASISASASASATAIPEGWVRTPFGLRKKDCVTAVPDGAHLSGSTMTLASGARRAVKNCGQQTEAATAKGTVTPPATATNGWQIASWWNAPTYLTVLNTRYAVPNAPHNNGAVVYLFSSFEPSNGSAIIQPVLQYGNNGYFGGNYWTIASWYLGAGNTTAYSTPLKVAPRDTIRGAMKASSCASNGTNCNWVITTQDLTQANTPQTNLNVTTPESFTTVQGGVLETYYATSCSQWPSSHLGAFSGIQVFKSAGVTLTPAFSRFAPDPVCSAAVTYTSTSTNITWTE